MRHLRSGGGGSLAPGTPLAQASPRMKPLIDLERCSNFFPGMTCEKERDVGVRGYAGEIFCFLLSRYSGPTWLIWISRSRFAIISDCVVTEVVFKYLQHTQADNNRDLFKERTS